MNRLLRFWMTAMVIAILLGGTLATAALAADQPTATGYSNVQLWVNPEYDEPSLLVMMQGTIVGGRIKPRYSSSSPPRPSCTPPAPSMPTASTRAGRRTGSLPR